MGILDRIKRQISNPSSLRKGEEPAYPEPRSATLLKQATQYKNVGDYDKAIQTLHNAYREISREGGYHTVETYLRLPMVLQLAGRFDDAWAEYNRLLSTNLTNTLQDPELAPMTRSRIYNKMRLMLQREGRAAEAVRFGAFEHVSWGVGLWRQKRGGEFRDCISAEVVAKVMNPILKKAKAVEAEGRIVRLIRSELSKPQEIDLQRLGSEVDAIIFAGCQSNKTLEQADRSCHGPC